MNFREGLQLYYKENPIQVPSCEYCNISKNSFFLEQLWCLLLCWVKKLFLFYALLASHYFHLSFHIFTFFSYILQFFTYSLLVRGLTGIFVWRKFELKHKPAFFNICFDGTMCSKWLIIKKFGCSSISDTKVTKITFLLIICKYFCGDPSQFLKVQDLQMLPPA